MGKSPAEELPVEGTPFVQPVEQEPGQGGEDTIAWLEQLAAEEDEKAVVSPSQSEAQPKEEETPKPESASEAAEEDVTITSWLSKLDVEEATGKGTAPSGTEAATPSAAEELPDWLKDFEQPGAPAERPRAGEELPEWLRRPAEPPETKPIPSEGGAEETTEGQAVSKPAAPSGSSSASELQPPAWLDENAPVAERAEPTTPEEWIPAEGQPAGSETGAAEEETPSVPAAPQPEPSVQPPIIKGTGMLSRVPAQDKDAEPFSAAQAALEANSLDEAMKEYGKLVKKGRLLDEIIHDLREAIYRFPVDVIVWQTLGDAYMRANRLQDALDAYTKAEELLR